MLYVKEVIFMPDYYEWDETPDYEYDEAAFRTAEEEVLQRHLEEHFPLTADFKEYKSEPICAYTIDEYLMYLIKGYYNVSVVSEFDKYLMEVLEDEWFHQWPLVRHAYASRLLNGQGCRKNIKRAVDLLLPLAEEGCPGAMYLIGRCYMQGEGLEQSYDKAISCWIKAGEKRLLSAEYWAERYHQLEGGSAELMFNFLYQVKEYYRESHGIRNEKDTCKLNAKDSKNYRKLCKQVDTAKEAAEKMARLHDIGNFFWTDDENPYLK